MLLDLTPVETFDGTPEQLVAERHFDSFSHPNLVHTRHVACQFGATLRIDTIELRGERIEGRNRTSTEVWRCELLTADAWWVLRRNYLDPDPGPEPWRLVRTEKRETRNRSPREFGSFSGGVLFDDLEVC